MNTCKEYKESFIEEKDSSTFKENSSKQSIKDENNGNDSSLFLSIDIQVDENNCKKFELNTIDELDQKLNSFCEENKLDESAKKYIHNSIIEKINQSKIKECKCVYNIYFSRKFASGK